MPRTARVGSTRAALRIRADESKIKMLFLLIDPHMRIPKREQSQNAPSFDSHLRSPKIEGSPRLVAARRKLYHTGDQFVNSKIAQIFMVKLAQNLCNLPIAICTGLCYSIIRKREKTNPNKKERKIKWSCSHSSFW